MTNGILEELNENIKKLISIFEVYPNPVDDAQQVKQAPKKKDEPKQEVTPAPEAVELPAEETTEAISDADLQKIVKQINETGEKGKLKEIKAYITKIGSPKITEVPQEKRPELVTFLEGLL